MTRKELCQILEIKGAIVIRGIDRSTDVALVFLGAKKESLDALSRLEELHKIKTINEEELLELVK